MVPECKGRVSVLSHGLVARMCSVISLPGLSFFESTGHDKEGNVFYDPCIHSRGFQGNKNTNIYTRSSPFTHKFRVNSIKLAHVEK